MYPGSESEYDVGIQKLRKAASLDISQADPLSDDGYVPYVWTEANREKQLFVKVLYADLREDTRKGLVQPFRLVCKIKDPTIHGATLKTASTETSDPTTSSGTAVYPFSYPIIYGASTYSVTSEANNEGDLPAYPQLIRVVGPINAPKVTNQTTGQYIQVNTNLASSSDVLLIRYTKDEVEVELNGASVIDQVDSASEYFLLKPGGNSIALTGSSVGSGAYVRVTFYDAWPLS